MPLVQLDTPYIPSKLEGAIWNLGATGDQNQINLRTETQGKCLQKLKPSHLTNFHFIQQLVSQENKGKISLCVPVCVVHVHKQCMHTFTHTWVSRINIFINMLWAFPASSHEISGKFAETKCLNIYLFLFLFISNQIYFFHKWWDMQ